MNKKGFETGGRNVFQDIAVPNAEEHLVKAQLVFKIDTIMKKRLVKLDQDIEIVIRPRRNRNSAPALHIF